MLLRKLSPMRLAEFILANVEPILVEWEAFARTLSPGATMTTVALRDDAESILLATARDEEHTERTVAIPRGWRNMRCATNSA